jgi:hypothetical protein
MLSLHDIFDKIKTKFQELECKWTGQMAPQEFFFKLDPKSCYMRELKVILLNWKKTFIGGKYIFFGEFLHLAFFCLKFSLQQIAIHIFIYQIKNRLQST